MSTSINPVLHEYTIADADDIFELALTVFSFDCPKPANDRLEMKNVLYDPNTKGWFIKDDKPVAFLLYTEDDFSYRFGSVWSYIEFIGTDNKYAGKGYAKQLLETYLHHHINQNLYLHVINNTSYTERLIRWYSKYGFKMVGNIKSGRASTMVKFANNESEKRFWEVKNIELEHKHIDHLDHIDHNEWCIH